MSYQAFDKKRKAQLGNLTRHSRPIENLTVDTTDKDDIKYRLSELEKIQKAHQEIVNEMKMLEENEGENGDRLKENADQFQDIFEEIRRKLRNLEKELTSPPASVPVFEIQRQETETPFQ